MNIRALSFSVGLLKAFRVLLITCGLCAVSAVHGSVLLIQDNFESYSQGTSPLNPGDGNSNNWVYSGYNTNTVIAGGSPGGLAPNEKVLHLQADGSSASSIYRSFSRQDGATTTDHELTLSFKLNLGQIAGSAYTFRLIDSEFAGTANNPMAVSILANGKVNVFSSATGPGTGGVMQVTVPTITLQTDRWYEFVLQGDLNDQTYSLSITDLVTSTTYSTASIYFLRNIQAVDRLVFQNNTTTNMAMNWMLDDVQLLSSIPEPGVTTAVFGLLLVGTTMVVRRSRNLCFALKS